MNVFYVYYLVHKETDKIFYVGKGKGSRLVDHIRLAYYKTSQYNSYLYRKIRKLLSENQTVVPIKAYCDLSETDAFQIEAAEIKRIGRVNLCNATDGGEGFSGGTFKQSDYQKRIVSLLFSKPKTDTHKQKLSQAKKDNPVRYWKNKTFTNEHRRKLSASRNGYKLTEEHKAKIIIAVRARKAKPPRPERGPNNPLAKHYIIISDGTVYERFSTLVCIAEEFEIKTGTLWKLLKTSGTSRKGLQIRLLEETNESGQTNTS